MVFWIAGRFFTSWASWEARLFIGTGICNSNLICSKQIIKKYEPSSVWDNVDMRMKVWNILYVEEVFSHDYKEPNLA